MVSSQERPVISAAAAGAAAAAVVGSPARTVQQVAGSVGNQDFLVRTDAVDVVLKAGAAAELEAEVWACRRLRRAGVAAPEILGLEVAAAGLGLPFLVMRCFPGEAAVESSPALAEAGAQLRLAHEIGLSGYGGLSVAGDSAVGSQPTWRGRVEEMTSGLDALVAGGVVTDALAAAVRDALADPAELHFEGPGVLLHGDLKLQHVFVADGRYVGLIDWGDASAGDPRYDLGRMSMAGSTALTTFLDGYGLALTGELERALTAYRLVWNVSALHYEHRAGGDWFDAYRVAMVAAVAALARG